MDIIKLSFAFLGLGMIVFVLRRLKEEYAVFASVAVGIIFFSVLVMLIDPFLELIDSIASLGEIDGYVETLLRALAISISCRVCAEICRDCGENAVALKIESLGRIGILILAMPILKTVLEMIGRLV